MANPTVEETRTQLKKAVEEQNFQAFDAAYGAFLSPYDLYQQQRGDGDLAFTNPIFGQAGSHRLTTTPQDQAVPILARARAASSVLAEMPVQERKELLQAVQKRIAARAAEIETTITADTGKPIKLARGEMTKGDAWFDWAYAIADGQIGKLNDRRKPMGAVQVIGAYNYPYALAIGGIVGGIAGGNGVIVSAPLKAPHWVFPFMQAAQEGLDDFIKQKGIQGGNAIALKAGLFQASFGINETLTREVDVVHFVGSDTVGRRIETMRPGKRTILEMGGTNVVTVLNSAVNTTVQNPKDKSKTVYMTPEWIAESIYGGFGPASGQRCTAPRILCVQKGRAEQVVSRLAEICRRDFHAHKLGNPFDDKTEMGPLVDRETFEAMKTAMARAESLGAKVSHAETWPPNPNEFPLSGKAYWATPVMIDWSNVPAEKMGEAYTLMQHEIFGPLLHVVKPVETIQQAVAFTNEMDHVNRLAGSVYSQYASDADYFQDATHVTSMKHNEPPKDMSPEQYHGHPDRLRIGGGTHFELYTQGPIVQQGQRFS